MSRGSSTVVESLTEHPKVKGSSPGASEINKLKITEEIFHTKIIKKL
jgi:hypothetical protein